MGELAMRSAGSKVLLVLVLGQKGHQGLLGYEECHESHEAWEGHARCQSQESHESHESYESYEGQLWSKAYVYGRVSSKKQIDGTGLCRQKQAALQRAKHVLGTTNLQTMNEIISGSKPRWGKTSMRRRKKGASKSLRMTTPTFSHSSHARWRPLSGL